MRLYIAIIHQCRGISRDFGRWLVILILECRLMLIAGVGGGVVAIVGIGAALYLMKMRATKVEQSPQTAH